MCRRFLLLALESEKGISEKWKDEQLILLSSTEHTNPLKACVRPFTHTTFSACVLFPSKSVKLHQLAITKMEI